MGLDLTLGALVLVTAVRGWLKGFLVQAIRLGGLVAAVYAAAPVRDQSKVYVVEYLPTMRAELIDRLLWWVAAVVSYFVIVGVASLAAAVSRRQTFGIAEPNRGNQFAGLGLGLIKGLIIASFVVAALQKYAQPQLAQISWAADQIQASVAWDWNERYQPAGRIWSAPPVQRFVNHIQQMGLMTPTGTSGPGPDPSRQAADQTSQLASPLTQRATAPLVRPGLNVTRPLNDLGASAMGVDPAMLRTVESLKSQFQTTERAVSGRK